MWSSLVTGTQTGQFADAVTLDPSGDVIVVGQDIAGTYPTTDRSFKRLPVKGSFISRFSSDGTTQLYLQASAQNIGSAGAAAESCVGGPYRDRSPETLIAIIPTTGGHLDGDLRSNGTGNG